MAEAKATWTGVGFNCVPDPKLVWFSLALHSVSAISTKLDNSLLGKYKFFGFVSQLSPSQRASMSGGRSFSSPEAGLLLVNTTNCDLCAGPTPEVPDSWTSRQIWQIWLVENMKRILCACSENQVQVFAILGADQKVRVLKERERRRVNYSTSEYKSQTNHLVTRGRNLPTVRSGYFVWTVRLSILLILIETFLQRLVSSDHTLSLCKDV